MSASGFQDRPMQENTMITTKRFEAEIPVSKYLEKYVDIEGFKEKCDECGKCGKFWSCPPFDFDIEEFWKKYSTVFVLAMKVKPDPKYRGQKFDEATVQKILDETLNKANELLAGELYVWEKKMPGSVSLSGGSCIYCEKPCTRESGEPCRHPEDMRYSLEAMGANVGKTITDLIGIEPLWVEDGVIPEYFMVAAALLY